MKLHLPSRPSLLALALLLSPAAWAQSELVALHPCNIVGVKVKQQLEDLQTTCATEIARGDVQLVSSDQVRAFLDKEARSSKDPQGSCAKAKKPAECLGKLAAATQASRAVLITVDPGQLTRVSGLVVNAQGEVVDQKSIQLRIRPGQSQGDVARTAITRLREQLNLVPLKIAPLVEQPAPPPLVATPAPTPSPEPSTGTAQLTPPPPTQAPQAAIDVRQSAPRTERTWKTPAAYASAGVGVVGLGLGVVFAITGNNAMVDSNKFYEGNNLPTFTQLDEVVRLREKASRDRTIAGVSAGVGAALVGTGVYLWLNDRPATPAPGTAALSSGPGGVSVHVLLP